MEADRRSIHPNIPGVPWWGALLIAFAATAIGYAIDAGHNELTHVFAGFYIAGCVIAVLVVRQSGVFTAVIQPPLILFCSVPGAYWLFHGRKVANLKDLLINCGYPLIERFPLMLGTAGGVLLIGLIRWYLGMSRRKPAADAPDQAVANTGKPDAPKTSAGKNPLFGGIGKALNSMLGLNSRHRESQADELAAEAALMHAGNAAPRTGRASRSNRSAARTSRSRSRHARPPLDEQHEPAMEQPRRSARRDQPPPRDFDPAEPPRRARRRPRPEGDSEFTDFRTQAPREMRREPRPRRDPQERPARGGRFEPYDRYDPAPERFKPYGPQVRRPAPNGTNGANPTHHPISQVRYRGSAPRDEQRDEPRQEQQERDGRARTHGRTNGRPPTQSWEYDS